MLNIDWVLYQCSFEEPSFHVYSNITRSRVLERWLVDCSWHQRKPSPCKTFVGASLLAVMSIFLHHWNHPKIKMEGPLPCQQIYLLYLEPPETCLTPPKINIELQKLVVCICVSFVQEGIVSGSMLIVWPLDGLDSWYGSRLDPSYWFRCPNKFGIVPSDFPQDWHKKLVPLGVII